jgi:metal-responsive CopG/Arc/MetJ family transcriptional regulator
VTHVFGINSQKKENNWEGRKKGRVFSLELSDQLYGQLDEISKKYGISKGQLVRDALIEKLNRLEKAS